MNAHGQPTDDPTVMVEGGGTLLPVGGLDHGHKGYGMALMVEALTQGLSGLGRHQRPRGTVMNVFLQVIDPEAFGGHEAFIAESSWLAQACRDNPPRPGVTRVRVPGEQALGRQRAAREIGVPLAAHIVEGLGSALQSANMSMPVPLGA